MKRRTTRLILDCMMCDAMSPEFKAANDILIRIIKTNDRTDGVPYPRLVELNNAFKANDVKAAKAAYDKLVAFIPKGEKTLHDELNESQEKLAETTKQIETAKKALAQEKAIAGMFDKFTKAIDTAKANPKMLSKLNVYADKLKQYGDFSKRIAQAVQMDKTGKDVTKQCDMLKKAVSDGKAKHAKAYKLAEGEFAKAKNRLAVYKEAVKIRTSKVADFGKEKDDIKKLGSELPSSDSANSKPTLPGNPDTELQRAKELYKRLEAVKADISATFKRETQEYKKRLSVVERGRKAALKEIDSAIKKFSSEKMAAGYVDALRKFENELEYTRTYGAYHRALNRLSDRTLEAEEKANVAGEEKLSRAIARSYLKVSDASWPVQESIDELHFQAEYAPDQDKSTRMELYRKAVNNQTKQIREKLVESLNKFGQPSVREAPKDFELFKKIFTIGVGRIENDLV